MTQTNDPTPELFGDQPSFSQSEFGESWHGHTGPCFWVSRTVPESVPHSLWLLERVGAIIRELDPLGLIECSHDPEEYRGEAIDHVFLVTAGAVSTGTVASIWAWSFAYDYLPRPGTITEIVERLQRLRTEWLALPGIPELARTGTDNRPAAPDLTD